MNISVIVIVCMRIASIYAFNVININPNGTMSINTREFQIESEKNIDLLKLFLFLFAF
jgi:hypothetical protein